MTVAFVLTTFQGELRWGWGGWRKALCSGKPFPHLQPWQVTSVIEKPSITLDGAFPPLTLCVKMGKQESQGLLMPWGWRDSIEGEGVT